MNMRRRYFRIHWPNWRRLFRYWVLLVCCWTALTATTSLSVQAAEAVSLTVKLRHSDGTAVVDETIILQQLPEVEPILPLCATDETGRCTWQVQRGVYQLLFERPLDEISALAVAEGGLHGLGITVGAVPITYHFTFYSDGRVYFDAAPEAAVPLPIIPEGEMLHGGVEPTVTPSPQPTEGMAMTATPSAEQTISNDDSQSGNNWRLFLFIGGGLIMGGGLHFWSRKRRKTIPGTTRAGNQEA